MASEIQKGKAVLYGITNSGSPISLEGYATFILSDAKFGHKWETDVVKDENNFDANLTATNAHIEGDCTWTPSGATRSAAAATATFLDPHAKVTLSNFAVSMINGDWIYWSDGSLDLSKKESKMSFKLRKYDDDAQNTSLTTTVVG